MGFMQKSLGLMSLKTQTGESKNSKRRLESKELGDTPRVAAEFFK